MTFADVVGPDGPKSLEEEELPGSSSSYSG